MLLWGASEAVPLDAALLALLPSWPSIVAINLLVLCLAASLLALSRQRRRTGYKTPLMKEVVQQRAAPPAAPAKAEPRVAVLGEPRQGSMHQPQQVQQLELLHKVQKQPSEKQLPLVRLSPVAEQDAGKTGSVRVDLPDGERHVSFADGSEYFGEWHGGTMHGRGIFFWPNGELTSRGVGRHGVEVLWLVGGVGSRWSACMQVGAGLQLCL